MAQVEGKPAFPGRIRVLPSQVANAIAAGEVVDRPASVVKELVENAVDAGSRRIEVEIRGGGREYMRVTDDGEGIAPDQVAIAFRRHATSKVSRMEDLEGVQTLGFRGEALPSVAAVARVELRSRPPGAAEGLRLRVAGGTISAPEPVGAPVGTSVTVRDLFFNTPARLKFLKTTGTERRYVIQAVGRLALAQPEIAIRLVAEGREVLVSAGRGDLPATALGVWGKGLMGALLPVGDGDKGGSGARSDGPVHGVRVWGFVGKPSVAKAQRGAQAFIVNGRCIESRLLRAALEKAYHGLLPSRHFPVAVLHLQVDPATVDVNVHPNKTEIRFRDEKGAFGAVLRAVRNGLLGADLVPRWGDGPGGSSRGGTEGIDRRVPDDPAARAVPPPSDPFPALPGGRVREDGGDNLPYRTSPDDDDPSLHGTAPPASEITGAAYRERFPALWEWPEAPARPAGGRQPLPSRPGGGGGGGARAVDPASLGSLDVLGQYLNTYIVARAAEGITILDQHVVHERILYENWIERLRRSGADEGATGADGGAFAHQLGLGSSQQLLVPVHLELSPEVVASISGHLDLLTRLGLTCEPFGSDGLLVRAVPLPVRDRQVRQGALGKMVEEIARVLERTEPEAGEQEHPGLEEFPPYLERILASMACRSAVMAGDGLEHAEMEALVAALAGAENPFRCPHGRPILIRMELQELERRFRRR